MRYDGARLLTHSRRAFQGNVNALKREHSLRARLMTEIRCFATIPNLLEIKA
jgi:hypothetical protein